mgnify:CR=1 FL=1
MAAVVTAAGRGLETAGTEEGMMARAACLAGTGDLAGMAAGMAAMEMAQVGLAQAAEVELECLAMEELLVPQLLAETARLMAGATAVVMAAARAMTELLRRSTRRSAATEQ